MKHLLIGDNSFLGISHLSQSRGRSRRLSLDTNDKVKVIEQAASCGATGFTFSADPSNFQVLKGLEDSGKVGDGFAIYPVLPYAARYVRAVNEKGITGLIEDIMSQLSTAEKAKLIVRGGISTLTFNPLGAMMSYIDSELSQVPKNIKIRSVLMHEVITDLGISFGAAEIFQSFSDHIREKWHTVPGFVTRNFTRFVDFFSKSKQSLGDIFIMAPFNSIGYQMNPSRTACESSLASVTGNVIAMSILAGGYLSLDEAIPYISKLSTLSGITIGVSSTEHAKTTFQTLSKLIQ